MSEVQIRKKYPYLHFKGNKKTFHITNDYSLILFFRLTTALIGR